MSRLKSAEIRTLSQQDLAQKLMEVQQEYFKLRLRSTTSHVKAFPSQKRELRKNIARLKTIMHENALIEFHKEIQKLFSDLQGSGL